MEEHLFMQFRAVRDEINKNNARLIVNRSEQYKKAVGKLPIRTKKYNVVGVDLGVKTFATLSNGFSFKLDKKFTEVNINDIGVYLSQLHELFVKDSTTQSTAYNTKLFGAFEKVKKILKFNTGVVNSTTSYLALNYNTVVIEDLESMSLNNDSTLYANLNYVLFTEFFNQLTYKCKWSNTRLIIAPRYFPSTRRCSNCGNIKDSMLISERTYSCEYCGYSQDRDLNAAINLEQLVQTKIN